MIKTYFTLFVLFLFSLQPLIAGEGVEEKATSFISGLVSKVDAKLPLSDDEKKLLVIIGLDQNEVDNLSVQDLMDRDFRTRVTSYFNSFGSKKEKEIKETATKEFIPGLASSTIGLGFASFFGAEAILVCPQVLSAKVFAGSAALWIGTEMLIWDGYKIEQEKIKQLGRTDEFNKKLKEVTARVKKRWDILKPKLQVMEDFNEDDLSLSNQEEGMDYIKDELALLRKDVKELVAAIGALKEKQFMAIDAVAKSIDTARKTTAKKARNAKLAAIGFTSASAVAASEMFWKVGQNDCTVSSLSPSLLKKMMSFIIPPAYAGVGLSDFDKIGIPAGAAAGYLVFRKKESALVKTPMSRSVLYGAMAANAMFAAAKLNKSANYLKEQHKEVEIFSRVFKKRINQIEGGLRQTDKIFNFLDKTIIPGIDHLLAEAQKVIDKGKEEVDKAEQKLREGIADLTDEEIQELEDKIAKAKEKAQDIKETVQVVLEGEDQIQSFIDEAKDSDWLNNFDLSTLLGEFDIQNHQPSYSQRIFNLIIPQAYAAVADSKRACLVSRSNFVDLDRSCSCQKTNSCYQIEASWPTVPKKHEAWLSPIFKMSAAHLKALNSFSSGNYTQANQYVGYIGHHYPKLNKIHQGLMKEVAKKSHQGFNESQLVLSSLKERAQDAQAFYRSPSSLAGHIQKTDSKMKVVTSSPVGREVQNQVALMENLSPSMSEDVARSVGQEESHQSKNYVIEAVEKDSDSDLFKLISHRYYVKYFNQL